MSLFRPLIFLFLILCASAQAGFFFPESYEVSRTTFISFGQKLKKDNATAEAGAYAVASKLDQDLSTDYLYLPAKQSPKNLVIITSGVHGVEAFTGAAIEFMLIETILPTLDLKQTGVLVIHCLNPFGQKYFTRVTEENVDLNRSLYLDRKTPPKPNPDYAHFDEFLNPKDKIRVSRLDRALFVAHSAWYLVRNSMAKFRQTILQGQYQFPRGLFYGGAENVSQEGDFRQLIQKYAQNYQTIVYLDLHTGYGKRGELHFLSGDYSDPPVKAMAEKLFQGRAMDRGGDKDFYDPEGETVDYVPKVLAGKLVVPMTFEYGTMDSQNTLGALESLRRMIRENQGRHFGYVTEYDQEMTTKDFVTMFNPPEQEWRDKIMNETKTVLTELFTRLEQL